MNSSLDSFGKVKATLQDAIDKLFKEKKKEIARKNAITDEKKHAEQVQYAADIEPLTKEIVVHKEDIVVWTDDGKTATKREDIETVGYDSLHKDYSECIEALQMAILVLK